MGIKRAINLQLLRERDEGRIVYPKTIQIFWVVLFRLEPLRSEIAITRADQIITVADVHLDAVKAPVSPN